jgi:hypothetical protein
MHFDATRCTVIFSKRQGVIPAALSCGEPIFPARQDLTDSVQDASYSKCSVNSKAKCEKEHPKKPVKSRLFGALQLPDLFPLAPAKLDLNSFVRTMWFTVF